MGEWYFVDPGINNACLTLSENAKQFSDMVVSYFHE